MSYLQPYKGKDTRHTCPSCGHKQSFTLYLDSNTNNPIHHTVGKCNRESKCGYHYTPKQFFIDNPSSRTDAACHVSKPPLSFPRRGAGGEVPFSYVQRSASYKSNFVRFLCEILTIEQITTIGENYALGATRNKEVIFWQIDVNGKVRTGKIMQYNPLTGKRLKHESGAIDWVHNKLKKSGALPDDYNLHQCFFGEHLLTLYPTAPVAIVESEKSAIIASAIITDSIWLAAGNINGLSLEKCQVLKGRNVILFPDLGAYDKWSQKSDEIQKQCNCKVSTSTLLEKEATENDRINGLDIADYIIAELKSPFSSNSQKVKFLSPDTHFKYSSPFGEGIRKTEEVGECTHRGIEVGGDVFYEIQNYFSLNLQVMIENNKALLVLLNSLQIEEL